MGPLIDSNSSDGIMRPFCMISILPAMASSRAILRVSGICSLQSRSLNLRRGISEGQQDFSGPLASTRSKMDSLIRPSSTSKAASGWLWSSVKSEDFLFIVWCAECQVKPIDSCVEKHNNITTIGSSNTTKNQCSKRSSWDLRLETKKSPGYPRRRTRNLSSSSPVLSLWKSPE
jgi:hypothetical protein